MSSDNRFDSPVNAEGGILVHDHPSFDISFHEHGRFVHIKWKGPQTSSTIQSGCNRMLQLLVDRGAGKILNDSRYSAGCWTTSLPWIVFRFLPQARNAGMRQAAHVISHDRASRLSADSFRLLADFCQWNIVFFRSVDQAKDWLEKDHAARMP